MALGRIIPLGAALCLAVPLVAQAQDAAAEAQGSAEPTQSSRPAQDSPGSTDWLVEEIVVTARKREEGLQSAPLSISAFTGEEASFATSIEQHA